MLVPIDGIHLHYEVSASTNSITRIQLPTLRSRKRLTCPGFRGLKRSVRTRNNGIIFPAQELSPPERWLQCLHVETLFKEFATTWLRNLHATIPEVNPELPIEFPLNQPEVFVIMTGDAKDVDDEEVKGAISRALKGSGFRLLQSLDSEPKYVAARGAATLGAMGKLYYPESGNDDPSSL